MSSETTKTTVRQGRDGHWYYLSTDSFVDGQIVGEIRPQWVIDAIAKLEAANGKA